MPGPTDWNREFLNYRYENHEAEDDPLRVTAEATARSPLFKSTINVTLAIRKALRRYLGIEPAVSGYEVESSNAQVAQVRKIRS